MTDIAIIGGTGLDRLEGLAITSREAVRTPWGEPSAPIVHGTLGGHEIAFLARHGSEHTIAPHRINYRANVWALKQIGATRVVAVAAVGGIHSDFEPGRNAIPDQMIDYTYDRAHTFHDDNVEVVHVDFTEPYSAELRRALVGAADEANVDAIDWGTYAATQGPRLETAAEIDRLERDGCHLVGMTGMPEAGLAREAGLEYAHLAVVANAAAGRGQATIRIEDIEKNLETGMRSARAVIAALVAAL